MTNQLWTAAVPLALLVVLSLFGIAFKRIESEFKKPKKAFWPFAENPGLAIQLTDSIETLNKILGEERVHNREVIERLQRLDNPFIFSYVFFFASVPLARSGWSWGFIVVASLAVLTAILDGIENRRIIRMLDGEETFPRRAAQRKWFFYLATLGAEGGLLFVEQATSSFRHILGIAIGVALVLIAVGGMISSVKGNFGGIKSAAKLSALGLIVLSLTPLIMRSPFPLGVTAEYIALLRVPILLGSVLVALPFIAFRTNAKTLLRGLFDLTPLSLFVVTISALAVSGTVCATASLTLKNASIRFKGLAEYSLNAQPAERALEWLIIMVLLALPIIAFSLWFSARQGHSLVHLVIAALGGAIILIGGAYGVIKFGSRGAEHLPFLSNQGFQNYLWNTGLFSGYIPDPTKTDTLKPWRDHLFAAAVLGCVFALYVSVGVYGWRKLGKKRTVPALCSALMLLLMLGWMLPALTFFFDAWRIPTLLIIAAVGFLTAQSHHSDHFYDLRDVRGRASDPFETIIASHEKRVIVVAANGGGIQAAAWAAQVLYGLHQDLSDKFQKSLRLISSVSGGSVGNAFFVNWLVHKKEQVDPSKAPMRPPDEAAAMSSLDEVAWGLAWPDFLRSLFPWIFGRFIDRGRALERAWLLNSAVDAQETGNMDEPLSSWNEKVGPGEIPAVIMNGTIAETGERLLFGTTRLSKRCNGGGAIIDATEVHHINDKDSDVGVATAARLSATFPYVTPAARSNGPGPQPHVVDGGYYDNYGMATLVEWLDEALEKAEDKKAGDEIESVLVIQIHGAPVDVDFSDEREAKSRGWFYQAFVPITTLLSVRSAGQVAHNNIELELMQQKWSAKKIPIHTVIFEFNNPDAPLSWHLTPEEREAIESAWDGMTDCKERVRKFLEGIDVLGCGCLSCKSVSTGSENGHGVTVESSVVRV